MEALKAIKIIGNQNDGRAAGQLRPLRHHIYRGAVVGVRGAAVGARGAVVGVRGAAVGNIGMHTYIRHICAPVHVYTAAVYMSQTKA